MKKGLLFFGIFSLGAILFLFSADAADARYIIGRALPDGFAYDEPEGCMSRCVHQQKGWKGNDHLFNAVGITGTNHGASPAAKTEITGVGWISSKKATSAHGSNANSYCAWCHAPSYAGVTSDPSAGAKFGKKELSPGVSCVACHPSHRTAGRQGTRLGNYRPGTDYSQDENWIFRHMEDGKQANRQCLWCHGSYHGFAITLHESMVKSGSLRCVDCHMAPFFTLSSGNPERYHNFKVYENGVRTCKPCHSFKNKEFANDIAKLFGAHTARKHKTPIF